MEKFLLILVSIVGWYFCYDFGYLLTGEHGVGALFGIPFSAILTILSVLTIFAKNKTKRIFRILTLGYILSIVSYILIIEIVKKKGDAGQYLYYPEGRASTILLWTLGTGSMVTLIYILSYKKDKYE